MRMLRRTLLGLIALPVLAGAALWLYLDMATQRALERGGEQLLGVSTHVGSVRVRPLEGAVDLRDVRIANPRGFGDAPFLELERGRVRIALPSVIGPRIEMPEIALDGLRLRLEKQGGRANYETLFPEDDSEPRGRKVHVRTLRIRNAVVDVDGEILSGRAGDLQLEIPEIVLHDIGSDADAAVVSSELTGVVVAAVLRAAAKRGLGLPLAVVRGLESKVEGVLGVPIEVSGRIRSIVDEAVGGIAAPGSDAARRLDEAVGSGADALRSLLGGKRKAPSRTPAN